jgi:predicted nucleotidyltransferase
MVTEPIAASVQRYFKACREAGIDVKFGVVYGSQATGHTHQYSDIDLIVVAARYDASRTYDDISQLWLLAAHVDHRIEPIACGEQQWEKDDASTIIEIARREGQVIYPEEEEAKARKA